MAKGTGKNSLIQSAEQRANSNVMQLSQHQLFAPHQIFLLYIFNAQTTEYHVIFSNLK